jgi:ribosomal protein L23
MFEMVMLAALSTAAFSDFTVEMVEALLRRKKSKKARRQTPPGSKKDHIKSDTDHSIMALTFSKPRL